MMLRILKKLKFLIFIYIIFCNISFSEWLKLEFEEYNYKALSKCQGDACLVIIDDSNSWLLTFTVPGTIAFKNLALTKVDNNSPKGWKGFVSSLNNTTSIEFNVPYDYLEGEKLVIKIPKGKDELMYKNEFELENFKEISSWLKNKEEDLLLTIIKNQRSTGRSALYPEEILKLNNHVKFFNRRVLFLYNHKEEFTRGEAEDLEREAISFNFNLEMELSGGEIIDRKYRITEYEKQDWNKSQSERKKHEKGLGIYESEYFVGE